ncbi:MAG: hypothetical protein QN183_10155 [Armatimonadota bacterium]|nr:hypothetical protein [Armatimonadota bacterium]MDR7536716.1 hypothetical protein [Armatimonadota bacterium]
MYFGIFLCLFLVALGLGAVALAFWQGRAASASPPGQTTTLAAARPEAPVRR